MANWTIDTVKRPSPGSAGPALERWYISLRREDDVQKIALTYPISQLDCGSDAEVEEKIKLYLDAKLKAGWNPVDLPLEHCSDLEVKEKE